ncbi:YitT family protein [Marinifilum sp.]|uniref:YitT family protein n=1 Tax=Marinifilum sp. TaxID=2033137 RepID=UPI003BAD98DF
MTLLQKNKFLSYQWIYQYTLVIAGTFIMAAGFVFFIDPHGIVPGGVYGVGIIINNLTQGMFPNGPFAINELTDTGFWHECLKYVNEMFIKYKGGIPIGFTGLLINIPLTILGIKVLGSKFGIKTVIGFILCTIFIDSLTAWWGLTPLVEDVLLSCVFGGILIGFGLALVFKARATTAGSDIIAMIIEKYTRISLGKLMIYVDSTIVLCSLIVDIDWQIPLYSWIVIYITGKAIDMTLQGSNVEKAILIISDQYELIRSMISNDLKRGGTFIQGQGIYNKAPKNMIFVVLNRRELSFLEDYIHRVDPAAFFTVMETNETIGKGFKSLKEKVEVAN